MRHQLLLLLLTSLASLPAMSPEVVQIMTALRQISAAESPEGVWLQTSIQHTLQGQNGVCFSDDGSRVITRSVPQYFLVTNYNKIPERSAYYGARKCYRYKDEDNEIIPNIWDSRTGELLSREANYPMPQEPNPAEISLGSIRITTNQADQRLEVTENGTIIGTLCHDQTPLKNEAGEIVQRYKAFRYSYAINPADPHEIATTGRNWLATLWYYVDANTVQGARTKDTQAILALVAARQAQGKKDNDCHTESLPKEVVLLDGAAPGIQKIVDRLTWKHNGNVPFTSGSFKEFQQ